MKKIVSAILLLAIALSLCACGSNADVQAYKDEIKALQQRIEELEALLGGNVPVGDGTQNEKLPGNATITLGQKVTIEDVLEFTINTCAWEDKILPSNTSGTYSYKADQEDETYLVLKGTLTNLNGNSFDLKYIQDSEILINGKYTFSIQMDAEDTDGKGFGDSPKPLQTVNFVIYSSVSDGVKDIFESAAITLNILNDPERTKYFFDAKDECKNTYTINLTKATIG